MTKQEFILALTKKLSHNADEYYTNAIVDIIILAQQLDEPKTKPEPQVAFNLDNFLIVLSTVKLHFRVKTLREEDYANIARLILERNTLMSIKAYKEAAGIGLKEAKDDIDKVQYELFMSKPARKVDYNDDWMMNIKEMINKYFSVSFADDEDDIEPIAALIYQGKLNDAADKYYDMFRKAITWDRAKQEIDDVAKDLRYLGWEF